MWITKQLVQKEKVTNATSAQVTMTDKNAVCTTGSAEHRYIPIYAPYGIDSVPPFGAQVLLLDSENGTVCAGTLCETGQAQAGELRLFSQGGAYIVLKNDGDILLNGVRITKEGRIIQVGE
ncbi:MAG: hypothetical protein EOM05_06075 [Clostridia bacterium]|nr:hypothetical protein [Clostridia bacterium]